MFLFYKFIFPILLDVYYIHHINVCIVFFKTLAIFYKKNIVWCKMSFLKKSNVLNKHFKMYLLRIIHRMETQALKITEYNRQEFGKLKRRYSAFYFVQ